MISQITIMKGFTLFVIFILLSDVIVIQSLHAQVKISGFVTSVSDKPIEGSNVLLLNSTDSVLIKGTVTRALGVFNFENIKPGRYVISASFTGFKTYTSNEINVAND